MRARRQCAPCFKSSFPCGVIAPNIFILKVSITMVTNITVILIFVTLSSVTSQTFQYSRGWTNGKRAGRNDDVRDIASNLDRVFSPCQMKMLRTLLEGKPWNERLLAQCEEQEVRPQKRYKSDHSPELYDVFQ